MALNSRYRITILTERDPRSPFAPIVRDNFSVERALRSGQLDHVEPRVCFSPEPSPPICRFIGSSGFPGAHAVLSPRLVVLVLQLGTHLILLCWHFLPVRNEW